MNQEKTIFKRGSTTFFLSSLFFPASVRKDVFDLYSFVRVADDYVDQIPADKDSFRNLRQIWAASVTNPSLDTTKHSADKTNQRVAKNMLRVARKHNFDVAWVESFLDAMESDITHKSIKTLDELLHYMYGSSEVVGLMMAKIMGLKPAATEAAQLQGRALQYLNFIRDIQEDIDLGRCYFPANDLKRFNLPDVTHETATRQPIDFIKFIHFQLNRYKAWQHKAGDGYKYIPKRLRIPVQTAVDMYVWTANEIQKNPLIIYEQKVKPSKARVLGRILVNTI